MDDPPARPCTAALHRLWPAIGTGPMFYAGCPDPAWLAERIAQGFAPLVVGFSTSTVVECRSALESAGLGVAVHEMDRGRFALPDDVHPGTYALTVLDGVLNQLWPDESDHLIAAARALVRPGGVMCVVARTTDDPLFDQRREGVASVARNTFHLGDGSVDRFVLPGELSAAFGDWILLHAVEKPGPPTTIGHEVWAAVVARRPSAGTLLA